MISRINLAQDFYISTAYWMVVLSICVGVSVFVGCYDHAIYAEEARIKESRYSLLFDTKLDELVANHNATDSSVIVIGSSMTKDAFYKFEELTIDSVGVDFSTQCYKIWCLGMTIDDINNKALLDKLLLLNPKSIFFEDQVFLLEAKKKKKESFFFPFARNFSLNTRKFYRYAISKPLSATGPRDIEFDLFERDGFRAIFPGHKNKLRSYSKEERLDYLRNNRRRYRVPGSASVLNAFLRRETVRHIDFYILQLPRSTAVADELITNPEMKPGILGYYSECCEMRYLHYQAPFPNHGFRDYSHLNRDGAAVFTSWFSSEILDL